MVKLRPYICAFGIMSVAAAAVAQTPAPSEPVAPPGPSPAPAAGVTPAPIDPPLEVPAAGGQVAPAPAAPGVVPEAGAPAVSPSSTRLNEFQGDDIGLVLRTLARQAGMNVVVSEKVQGTVTMRLENKTPRDAIRVIVNAKGLVMDELDDVYYIKTQEERQREPAESASYTFAYATAEKVAPLLKDQLASGLAPQYDQRTNTIYYRETKSNMDKIRLFLESVDRPTQQVMIEARLVEVTANPQQAYGINWAGVVGGPTNPQTVRWGGSTIGTSKIVTNPTTGQVGVVPDQLPQVITDQTSGRLTPQDFLFGGPLGQGMFSSLGSQFAILSVPQMSATLQLLNEDRDAEFLANPRVVTSNNQKAEIKITRAQPVPQLNFNEQTATAQFSGFQDKEFGNTLIVTPTINKDGFISLNVKPEISNKVGDATFTFAGSVVTSPIIDKRTLDSNVLIHSGDTLAIGGLLQDETIKQRTKVPVLGDLPIIGYAFQQRNNSRQKRNLLVFVTPTVIQQGYGTGLEDQASGLHHSGDEYADPNGWRNNARGAVRLVPTSNRQVAADVPAPGIAPAPRKGGTTRATVKSRTVEK